MIQADVLYLFILLFINSVFYIRVGINLNLVNACSIKLDQLKCLSQSNHVSLSLFWPCTSYNLLHLLSTNHKCTHACFIKTNAAQNKIIVRSSLKILEISRRMSPSQLPVKFKSAAIYRCLFIRLRLRLLVM
jgi:hypothetical protein